MKLTESKLRNIIREELSKLTELGVDYGFMSSFKETIENMTGVKVEIQSGPEKEDAVFLSTEGNPVEIIFRSGASTGMRGGNDRVAIQIVGAYSGSVRSGFDAPSNPQKAAERTVEELQKINAI